MEQSPSSHNIPGSGRALQERAIHTLHWRSTKLPSTYPSHPPRPSPPAQSIWNVDWTAFLTPAAYYADTSEQTSYEHLVQKLLEAGAVFRNREGKVVDFAHLDFQRQVSWLTFATRPAGSREELAMGWGKGGLEMEREGSLKARAVVPQKRTPSAVEREQERRDSARSGIEDRDQERGEDGLPTARCTQKRRSSTHEVPVKRGFGTVALQVTGVEENWDASRQRVLAAEVAAQTKLRELERELRHRGKKELEKFWDVKFYLVRGTGVDDENGIGEVSRQ